MHNNKKMYAVIIGTLVVIASQVHCSNRATLEDSTTCRSSSRYRHVCCETKKSEIKFKGELLYWCGALAGLEGAFGTTTMTTVDLVPRKQITLSEADHKPDFEWRPGFRLGANFLFHNLDLEADWTSFHGRAHYNKGNQHGNWKLLDDVIDLTFGYNFYPCTSCNIKPILGFRGAIIHQNLKSHLEIVEVSVPPSPRDTTNLTDMDDKEDFWGIGPVVGIEAGWYLGSNFSLYGMFDIATYYGQIKSKSHDIDTLSREIDINDLTQKRYFDSFGTDGAIGVRWDKYGCYSNCDVHYMLKLGFEQHRIYDLSNLGTDGSLSLDGGVLEASLGFRF